MRSRFRLERARGLLGRAEEEEEEQGGGEGGARGHEEERPEVDRTLRRHGVLEPRPDDA